MSSGKLGARPRNGNTTHQPRAISVMMVRLPHLGSNQPTKNWPRNTPPGAPNRASPSSPSDKRNCALISGMRTIQLAKMRPWTRKRVVTANRACRGSSGATALAGEAEVMDSALLLGGMDRQDHVVEQVPGPHELGPPIAPEFAVAHIHGVDALGVVAVDDHGVLIGHQVIQRVCAVQLIGAGAGACRTGHPDNHRVPPGDLGLEP